MSALPSAVLVAALLAAEAPSPRGCDVDAPAAAACGVDAIGPAHADLVRAVGSAKILRERVAAAQLAAVRVVDGGAPTAELFFDDQGRAVREVAGPLVVTATYDARGRLVRLVATRDGAVEREDILDGDGARTCRATPSRGPARACDEKTDAATTTRDFEGRVASRTVDGAKRRWQRGPTSTQELVVAPGRRPRLSRVWRLGAHGLPVGATLPTGTRRYEWIARP